MPINENEKDDNVTEHTTTGTASSGMDQEWSATTVDPVGDISECRTGYSQIVSETNCRPEQNKFVNSILIIHDKDQDGYCAANIVKQYKKQPTVNIGMVPVGHSTDLRTVVIDPDKWNEVFIVDLVPPATWINDLILNGFKVTIIDHHESTRNNVENIGPVSPNDFVLVYSDTLSAAGAAWHHLYGQETPMPWVVKMINDWDVWNHEDPQVIPFHYGMECIDLSDWKIWKQLLKGDPASCSQIMQMGQMVGSFWINQQNEITSSQSFTCELEGIKFLVCNGWFTSSYDFAAAMQKNDCDAILWFRYSPNQGDYPWQISMRTDKMDKYEYPTEDTEVLVQKGVNLLKVAKKFRGGGHPTSCGCNLTTEEMLEILNKKNIQKEEITNG